MLTIEGMLDTLSRLRRLPFDWDGCDSPKITEEAIESCKRVIQGFADEEYKITNKLLKIGEPIQVDFPTFLYPMTGGGLSFMWEGENFSRILIMPDGAIVHRTKGE